MVSVFNDPQAIQKVRARPRVRGKMRATTLREFGGGWNEVDSPVGLSTRFANVLKNWYRKSDGSQSIRFGTILRKDISLDSVVKEPVGPFTQPDLGAEAVGDANADGKNFGFKFAAPVDSTQLDIYIEVTTVTQGANFTPKLYTNAGASPGVLIQALALVDISATGFRHFAFTGLTLTQSLEYWFILSEDSSTNGNIELRTVDNQGGSISSGKSDILTSIADGQLSGGADFKFLVNFYRPTDATEIIDHRFFNNYIINVTDEGEIIAVDALWNAVSIWDQGLAQTTEAMLGWSSGLDFVSFTEIKGSLVVCNGIDKPIEITEDLITRYLQDLSTGSNVNVPIGKYCTTVSDYLCIAGIEDQESVVYIGAKGTVGVFPGDPDPNDAVALDLGAYVPEDSREIRGLSSFRNSLFVHFLSGTLQVTLGEYDEDGNHVPRVNDTLQKFGLLSHRCVIPIINDLLFADIAGVNTARRSLLTNTVEPDRLSELIAPAYQRQIAGLDQAELLKSVFAVHDRLAGHYMIFVPTGIDDQKRVFTFTFNDKMRIRAWSEFVGWTFRCACSSGLGRVFLAKGMRIYQYGNEAFDEEFSADLIGEYDANWANNTVYAPGERIRDTVSNDVYICAVGHTSAVAGTFEADRTARPTLWDVYEGEDIEADWELPWMDAGARARLKRMAFLSLDTAGTSKFNVDIFVDNIYLDINGDYDPALTLEYTGGDSPGYGGGDQPYGGGRRTRDERLWSHPVKFKIAKLRIHAMTKLPLRVITINILHAEGKFGR